MSVDWSAITNQKLRTFLLIAILLWIVGFLSGNNHFINYGFGVFIADIILYILRRYHLKDN